MASWAEGRAPVAAQCSVRLVPVPTWSAMGHRIPAAERDRVRKDLLDYCERDTWATVRLLATLRRMIPSPDLRNDTTII